MLWTLVFGLAILWACVLPTASSMRVWSPVDRRENPCLSSVACPSGFQCYNVGPNKFDCFDAVTGTTPTVWDVSTWLGKLNTKATKDGVGTEARFNRANAGAFDPSGNLYVADGNTIRKVTPSGAVTTLAGSANPGCTDGVGTAAKFQGPTLGVVVREFTRGVTPAAAGQYVVVVDMYCQKVRKIAISSGQVSTVAGSCASYGRASAILTVRRAGSGASVRSCAIC